MTTERYYSEVPLPLRLLGCWGIQHDSRHSNYRCHWGEFNFTPGFALQYSVYHETAHIIIRFLFSLYIKAPMIINQRPDSEDWDACYGFTWFERALQLSWRDRTKIIHAPWDWEHVRHTFLWPDGTVHHDVSKRGYEPPPEETKQTYSYTYTLKNGTVQHRTATINGEDREWRWKLFANTIFPYIFPFMKRSQRSINVEFDDEVGERTGSWKGGTIGCGWAWLLNETQEQSLRRMERDREF